MTTSVELVAKLRRLNPKAIDLGLERMLGLLDRLGRPQLALCRRSCISPAPTPKARSPRCCRRFSRPPGQRVHRYTSPPLRRLHDQIVLASAPGRSRPITERQLAAALQRVIDANGSRPITSFEGETAAALLAFAETSADTLILETGLGGRQDATNVVDRPALTILTPVSIDHAEFLGHSVGEIAGHKAGILKRGVPAVIARQPDEALVAIEAEARRLAVPLAVFGRDFDAYEQHGRLVVQHNDGLFDLPLPALVGHHQLENAGVAVVAALHLVGPGLDEDHIADGLRSVRWPARLERLDHRGLAARHLPAGSEIWLDGGHNRAAAEVLARAMADEEERSPKPLHIVVGMLKSKDPKSFLAPFVGLARSIVAVPVPDVSRAYAAGRSPGEIAADARILELDAYVAANVGAALAAIARAEQQPVRILVTGSFHLAGSVLTLQEEALAATTKGPD